MRALSIRLLLLCLLVLPAAAAWSDPDVALRGEGYVGNTHVDLDVFGLHDKDDVFQGGGQASVALIFDGFYMQADGFGDSTDFQGRTLKAGGGLFHLGWRDATRGSFGPFASFTRQDPSELEIDHWQAGLEGEVYLDRVTLAATAAYAEIFDDDSTGHFEVGASIYPIDRIRLRARGGVLHPEDDGIGLVGISAEFLVARPVGLFARWEGAIPDSSGGIEQHSFVVGARLYWAADEPSLVVYDRGYLRHSCDGYLSFGRVC